MEFHGGWSRGFARVAVEGEIAGLYLDVARETGNRLTERRVRIGEIKLDIALATDVTTALVAAFMRVDIVVAATIAAVERNPDVLEHGAVLVLILRGAGGADREDGAILLDL